MGYTGQKKREYQLGWMMDRKQEYMDKLGPCYFCDTTENLEIHHIDPESKESHKIWSWSKERIEKELMGCVVICGGCHKKLHKILNKKIVHGTRLIYRKGCRCDECKKAKSEYEYRWKNCLTPSKNRPIVINH